MKNSNQHVIYVYSNTNGQKTASMAIAEVPSRIAKQESSWTKYIQKTKIAVKLFQRKECDKRWYTDYEIAVQLALHAREKIKSTEFDHFINGVLRTVSSMYYKNSFVYIEIDEDQFGFEPLKMHVYSLDVNAIDQLDKLHDNQMVWSSGMRDVLEMQLSTGDEQQFKQYLYHRAKNTRSFYFHPTRSDFIPVMQ